MQTLLLIYSQFLIQIKNNNTVNLMSPADCSQDQPEKGWSLVPRIAKGTLLWVLEEWGLEKQSV